jgi:hypothetical protein
MPYEFPTRYLRNKEVIDPDDITLETRGATSLLSGSLDAHNLNAEEDWSDHLGYRSRYGLRHSWTSGECSTNTVRDPDSSGSQRGMPTRNSYSWATVAGLEGKTCSGSDFNRKKMANSSSWQTVRSVEVPSVPQGTRLWITSFCQYLWWGEAYGGGTSITDVRRMGWPGHLWLGGDADEDPYPQPYNSGVDDFPVRNYGARVQLAIRVNGRIVDESVTGSQDPEQKAISPMLMKVERGGGKTQFPGPSMQSIPQRSSLNTTAWPVRFGCVVDIPPGDAVVELVFRRLEDHRYTKKYGSRRESNYIAITAAQLLVMDLPQGPGEKTDGRSFTLPAFKDQMLLSEFSVYTDRLAQIENELRSLNVGSVGPGALHTDHVRTSTVISRASLGFHAKDKDGQYTGFTTTNRRPNAGWQRMGVMADGTIPAGADSNPEKPAITYKQYDRRGWMLWGVHDGGQKHLEEIGVFGSDTMPDRRVVGTGNTSKPEIVPSYGGDITDVGDGYFIDYNLGYAVLQGDWKFEKGRRRTLVVMADASVLSIVGDKNHKLSSSEYSDDRINHDRADAASTCNAHACFRIGFHVKGQGKHDGWVLPCRSEARVSQMGNFRQHGNFAWRMPTFANVATMLVLDRPWRDEAGTSWFIEGQDPWPGDEFDTYSMDYTIDAIGLFVCGVEAWRVEGPTVGLSSARISAFLVDQGPY